MRGSGVEMTSSISCHDFKLTSRPSFEAIEGGYKKTKMFKKTKSYISYRFYNLKRNTNKKALELRTVVI